MFSKQRAKGRPMILKPVLKPKSLNVVLEVDSTFLQDVAYLEGQGDVITRNELIDFFSHKEHGLLDHIIQSTERGHFNDHDYGIFNTDIKPRLIHQGYNYDYRRRRGRVASTFGGKRSAESAMMKWAQTGFSPLRERVIQWVLRRMRVGVNEKCLVFKMSESSYRREFEWCLGNVSRYSSGTRCSR